MIVLIGLLLLLCLLGAWCALRLEEPKPPTLELDDDELDERPWAHVQSGPDSFHPVGSWRSTLETEDDANS